MIKTHESLPKFGVTHVLFLWLWLWLFPLFLSTAVYHATAHWDAPIRDLKEISARKQSLPVDPCAVAFKSLALNGFAIQAVQAQQAIF